MSRSIEEIKKMPKPQSKAVRILTDKVALNGELYSVENKAGIIIFSQENPPGHDAYKHAITNTFNKNKLAVLFPCFSPFPEDTERGTFLRAQELEQTTFWARKHPEIISSPLGYFADGVGVPAALIAAATHSDQVQAVVLLGGKPDHAFQFLPDVKAPVLLIAAGRDPGCIRSHQRALSELNANSNMSIITRASLSFNEPGVMEEASQLAALWFLQHLD